MACSPITRPASPSAWAPVDRLRRRSWDALVILGIAAAATLFTQCGDGIDARRATLCRRAIPTLVPAEAVIKLLRIGGGPSHDSIRVDYRLSGHPEAATKARWVICGFGPGSKLVSVTTEAGPLTGASVYMLERYFLDTPEAEASDPGAQ